jgi:hypothetical protein
LTRKTPRQLWDWSQVLSQWNQFWAPETPLKESYLWEGLGSPPLEERGALILGVQDGDQPDLVFCFPRGTDPNFIKTLYERLRLGPESGSSAGGMGWLLLPPSGEGDRPRDLWGWFAHGGEWWITEGLPQLQAFWIRSSRQQRQTASLQASSPFSHPFLWAPLAKVFPQSLGKNQVRWVPQGWQRVPQNWLKFRWEEQIFYAAKNWEGFLKNMGIQAVPARDDFEGIAWLCEVGGGQLPLIHRPDKDKEVLLKGFWKNNLTKLDPQTFQKGGQSLLSRSPYFSTLLYYLGDSDAMAILGNFLLVHPEFRRGGLSRLFYYKGKTKGGSRYFTSPFFSRERLQSLLPPGHELRPDRFALDFQEFGSLNTSLLKELQAYPEAKLPLTPLGRNLLLGLQKKIQEEIQAAIQEKRKDGFPDQFFRETEPSNKQWGMHYLSDRTIALALFAAEEDIWRDLRYHVSPRRMERLLDEKAVIRGQLGRGQNLLEEMWMAFEQFQFRLESPFLSYVPL